MTDGRTRRKVLEVIAVAGTSIIAGCQTSGDSDSTTPTATDTATPTATETPTPTPTETATPEPDLYDEERMSPYQKRTKEIKDRFDDDVDQDVQNMFDEGNEIQALEKVMEDALEDRAPAMPAFYEDREEYINSGAVKALSQALKLYDIDDENAETTDQGLGTHRLEYNSIRAILEGVETDVAAIRDTQKDETVVATKYKVPPEGEGDRDEAYQPGQQPQSYVGKALKGLYDSDDIVSGTSFDWESWNEVVDSLRNYDPEGTARQMSRYFGDIVAGPSLTYGDWIEGSEEVQHPMLFTDKFHKELSEGASLGLVDRTREITNKVAETNRASSEIYVVGEGGKVIATDYDFSHGIPESLSAV